MTEFQSGVSACILPVLFLFVVGSAFNLEPILASSYHSKGDKRDGLGSILYEITIANCLLIFLFTEWFPIENPKQLIEWILIFFGFWPFWLFVGGHIPIGDDLKSAWRNSNQTWTKVLFGICFSGFSIVIFLVGIKVKL